MHASIVMNICFLEGIAKIDVLRYIHLYIPSLHFDQLDLLAKMIDRPSISRFCFWQMFNDFFLNHFDDILFFFKVWNNIIGKIEKSVLLFLNIKLFRLYFIFKFE